MDLEFMDVGFRGLGLAFWDSGFRVVRFGGHLGV